MEILWLFCQSDDDDHGDDPLTRDVLLHEIVEPALSGFDIPTASSEGHDSDTVRVIRLYEEEKEKVKEKNSGTDRTTSNHNMYVSELFWGPTFCFKDLGMRVTIGLLDYFARCNQGGGADGTIQSLTLCVSTTGDTGPACVQAVSDLTSSMGSSSDNQRRQLQSSKRSSKLGLIVHYPKGQISELQRRQLTTATSTISTDKTKIQIVCYEGGGDDMDIPIKNIMTKSTPNDGESNSRSSGRHVVCGVNSYNIGRPLMQMVHFVWTYLRVFEKEELLRENNSKRHRADKTTDDDEQQKQSPPPSSLMKLNVVIPTGAMGNAVGCYMAKKLLGVPISTIVCACNVNDTTYQVMEKTGLIQRPSPSAKMQKTLSDAINIQLPYNLERLLFYLTGGNHQLLHDWYSTIESSNNTGTTQTSSKSGVVDLNQSIEMQIPDNDQGDSNSTKRAPKNWFRELQKEFRSVRVTDDQLCDTMRVIRDKYHYVADPHTGVAFHAARQLGYFTKDGNSQYEGDCSAEYRVPVAVMSTASPCKFQESVTVALGAETWEQYYHNSEQFPSSAKQLFTKPETEPILYRFDRTKSLAENQIDWESQTRRLIKELQQ